MSQVYIGEGELDTILILQRGSTLLSAASRLHCSCRSEGKIRLIARQIYFQLLSSACSGACYRQSAPGAALYSVYNRDFFHPMTKRVLEQQLSPAALR